MTTIGSNLAKPIYISDVFIKNRIAMAPMNDLHQFYDPIEGTVNRRWIDYFAERSRRRWPHHNWCVQGRR